MKRDLYKEVTDRIVAALEAGTVPFIKPWTTTSGMPENAVTGRPYRGINVLLLSIAGQAAGYASDQWLTFKQALAAGVPVRKGEKATRIYFFKRLEVEEKTGEAEGASKVIPMLREYYVFNVAQLEGTLPNAKAIEPRAFVGDATVDAYLAATGAKISHGGDRAYYSSGSDEIRLPAREAFTSATSYYAVALHELTHWTGHESRMARTFGKRFGDEAYAAEELVAEMGAAFVCAGLGLEYTLQHAAYIASWIRVLKNDKRAIFTAASAAQKAVDYLTQITSAAAVQAAAA